MAEKSEMTRRDFLKISAAVAAVGLGFNPRSVEKQDAFETHEGQVNEGESLTTAAERISGRKDNSWSTFSMIWKNPQTDCDYHFKNKQAYEYQDAVPLPSAKAGDKIFFGTERGVDEKRNEPGLFTSKDRVTIDSNVKKDGDKIETHLTVFGGRFDRTVFYMLDENRNWKVNTKKDEWADAKILKELMLANPEMKSSEALSQI